MKLRANEISELIKQRIDQFTTVHSKDNEGSIVYVGDGIIKIYGLSEAMQGEMLLILGDDNYKKQYAIALNLEQDSIGAIVLGSCNDITEGMKVRCTGKILEVPVGYNLLGRVINSLGDPIDGKGSIKHDDYFPVENQAPGVIDRKSITEPIQTGYKSIDSMIPIGRGQRELIIGDRQTGKTALAIDTIINQRFSGILCIYVAIGQRFSTIVNVVNKLKEYDSLKYTVVVVASASESASLQYLSPYSGSSVGEYFRNQGENALIVYDDLSKHAVAYRQISLLLRRPPGREAYPGDIFYLHSRLLERSARVTEKYLKSVSGGKMYKRNGGSLTALPIIETQLGDVSSFVPTNVISITDGQIFLESSLFNSGIRPAVNPGISVSRVGSSAQSKIIKFLSSGIKASLAQYRELAVFSQFASDLDETTRKHLIHGQKLTEILKQKQYHPMSIAEQAIVLFVSENNFLVDVPLEKIVSFEELMLNNFNRCCSHLIKEINLTGNYDDSIKEEFIKFIKLFKKEQCY